MKRATIPGHNTVPPHGALSIWRAFPLQSGASRSMQGGRTRPISPRVAIVENIPAAAIKQVPGGQAIGRIVIAMEPVALRPTHTPVTPFSPRLGPCLIPDSAKSVHASGLKTQAGSAIKFEVQPYIRAENQRAGAKMTAPHPIAPQLDIRREAWRAPVRPSAPAKCRNASIRFEAQPVLGAAWDGSAEKASRKLARLRGFALDLPPVEVPKGPTVRDSAPAVLWNSESDMDLATRCSLRNFQEYPCRHQPSTSGIPIPLSEVLPRAALVPFSPGLNGAVPGLKPSLGVRDPFIRVGSEVLPLFERVQAPSPVVALSSGLPVWTGTVNSYSRRKLCAPRVRDKGRVIHVLMVAPVRKAAESSKNLAKSLSSTKGISPII